MRGPVLERYEILGELGQGGMSVVYRARDKQLARDVAVKVLHDFLARQPDARKRFHREAVAVAKLHHPGILEIFDYSGLDAKSSYIVTELIEGETLRELIDRRGRVPYPEIGVLLVAELVRALRHAHEQSVIHRDLKPENVMITKDGVLKLMDFGLAQLMDGGTRLTATGTLLGSPAHMAPELIDGKMSDARADIFSMGTILYWLTTGKLPFEAPNPSALFKRILDGKYEDPQMLEPKIGNGLARVIKRALEPDPELRYQDVTELHADLIAELQQVELEPVELQARRYLTDPEGFARELGPKLIALLAASGKTALKEGNLARAMDRFNRVLAIDPDHHEVRTLVARVGRRKELARRAKQLAIAGGVALSLGGAAYGLSLAYPMIVRSTEKPAEPPVVQPVRVEEAQMDLPEIAPVKDEPPAKTEPPVVMKRAVDTLKRRDAREKEKEKEKDGARLASAGGEAKAPAKDPEVKASDPPPKIVKHAKLHVAVGNGFAKLIIVDGRQRECENGMYETVDLAPGKHEIALDRDGSRSPSRIVEVDENGAVLEIAPDGRRVAIPKDELRLKAPP